MSFPQYGSIYVSARSDERWWWQNKPSGVLLGAAFLACSLSTVMANVWPSSSPDGIPTIGLAIRPPVYLSALVWLYCIICWFLQVRTHDPELDQILAVHGPCERVSAVSAAWLTLFSVIFFGRVQDAAKVGTYALLRRFNIFNINNVSTKAQPVKKVEV